MKNYSIDIYDVDDNVWCKMAFDKGIKLDFSTAVFYFIKHSNRHPAGNVRLMHGDICVMHNR